MPEMDMTDWTGCPLVEVNPWKVRGAPVLRGTRLPVQAILDNHADGLPSAETAEQFQVPEEKVRAVIEYARGRRSPVPHPA